MKFKFQHPGKEDVKNCCCQKQANGPLNISKVTVCCINKALKPPFHEPNSKSWVPVSHGSPVINTNTCYYNPEAYHLEARSELLTWMLNVSTKLCYTDKTYHLAVHILDAVLSIYDVEVENVKLVTYIALHLAAKMEESTDKVPSLHSVTQLFNDEFGLEQLKSAEIMVFSIMGYNLHKRTVLVELLHVLRNGVLFCSDITAGGNFKSNQAIEWMEKFFNTAQKEIILEYELTKFHPKIIAAALVYTARGSVGIAPWTDHLASINNVSAEEMQICVNFLAFNFFGINQEPNSGIDSKTRSLSEMDDGSNYQEFCDQEKYRNAKGDQRKVSQSSIYTNDGAVSFSPFN